MRVQHKDYFLYLEDIIRISELKLLKDEVINAPKKISFHKKGTFNQLEKFYAKEYTIELRYGQKLVFRIYSKDLNNFDTSEYEDILSVFKKYITK